MDESIFMAESFSTSASFFSEFSAANSRIRAGPDEGGAGPGEGDSSVMRASFSTTMRWLVRLPRDVYVCANFSIFNVIEL
jgi:hypothetical protein